MIENRADYLAYLEADRLSLGRSKSLRDLLFDEVWRFQRLLRKVEYLTNTGASPLRLYPAVLRFRRLSRKLGFSIPPNCFGPGLAIAHYGTIVVNHAARIGANCRIHVCTNVGTAAGHDDEAPVIGDNCYIAPGAKLFGPIRLGNDVAIAANAVVNRSFPRDGVTLGGVPARIISEKGSRGLVTKGYPAG